MTPRAQSLSLNMGRPAGAVARVSVRKALATNPGQTRRTVLVWGTVMRFRTFTSHGRSAAMQRRRRAVTVFLATEEALLATCAQLSTGAATACAQRGYIATTLGLQ